MVLSSLVAETSAEVYVHCSHSAHFNGYFTMLKLEDHAYYETTSHMRPTFTLFGRVFTDRFDCTLEANKKVLSILKNVN